MPTNLQIKNTNVLHVLRVRNEDAVREDVKDESGKVTGNKRTGKWKPVATTLLIKPGETGDVWLGGDRRVIIDELPT
jgi:hypothetical protein